MKFRVDEKDLKIFICFSILLLYLCAVAVLNLHSLATSGTIYGFVPFEAFSKEFIAPTLILFFLSHIENGKNPKKLSKVFSKEYKLAKYLQLLGVEYGK